MVVGGVILQIISQKEIHAVVNAVDVLLREIIMSHMIDRIVQLTILMMEQYHVLQERSMMQKEI